MNKYPDRLWQLSKPFSEIINRFLRCFSHSWKQLFANVEHGRYAWLLRTKHVSLGGSIIDSNLIEDCIYFQVEHPNIMEYVLFEIRFLQQQRRPKMVLQTFWEKLRRFGHTRWTCRVLFKIRRLSHINNVSDRKKSIVKILCLIAKKTQHIRLGNSLSCNPRTKTIPSKPAQGIWVTLTCRHVHAVLHDIIQYVCGALHAEKSDCPHTLRILLNTCRSVHFRWPPRTRFTTLRGLAWQPPIIRNNNKAVIREPYCWPRNKCTCRSTMFHLSPFASYQNRLDVRHVFFIQLIRERNHVNETLRKTQMHRKP